MEPILTTESLFYESDQQMILQDISIMIESGSHVTITGPSGSGKSTLLKLLASLLTPTKGKIIFEGADSSTLPIEEYRMAVSYCFQQPSLFGDTVKDNFLFPYQIRKKSFDERHAIELLDDMQLKPDYLNKPIKELSGGEKQRVALIRNVLFLPKVLLLDEVTAGLDQQSKEIVNQWLTALNRERKVTLIRVTHDNQEIANAQKLIQIKEGQVVENESSSK
ncbi:ABC transporter ATP-binding protein [Enterococcus sp. AZ192]|uniref:ABC transporter ATP-binding protein n=1 Tax=unclassified Enterococcus TaxID=2608891 RepID=UPI003D27D3B3